MKTARPYQQQAIEYMRGYNTYLCDDCGLGKTFTSLRTLNDLGTAQRHNLVICRKTARLQWQEEILEEMPGVDVVFTDRVPYDFRANPAWYITYYNEINPNGILYTLGKVVWDGIILDEAHKIKNYHTQRSKHIVSLVGARKIALSATPIEKHGGELWPVLKWLDREYFPSYWKWVESMFEVSPGLYGGIDIGDPLDRDAYIREVSPYIIKRSKKQVDPDLPERVDITVPIEMGDEETKAWVELYAQRDVLVKIQDVELLIENALALHTRLHQLSVLPSLLGLDIKSSKFEWLKEFVEDHPDMRLVVFTRYNGVVQEVKRLFNAFVVAAGVDESQRFKKGDGNMLVGTIDSMSESLSLEMADAAIFMDQHWSSTQMRQAVDRIHRMNITEKKFVYYLTSSPTDDRVMDVVSGKVELQQMLLNFVHGK